MIELKTTPKRKIIQRVLIGGIILGIASSVVRILISFFAVLAIPAIMGGGLSGQSSNEFLANSVVFLGMITPYFIGLGAMSIFLYVFIFPDKKSRGVLVGWGILMSLYLIATTYLAWL